MEEDGKVSNLFILAEKIENRRNPQSRQTILANIERKEPARSRRSDIRAHEHADRLFERHDAAVHETERHDRGRGARLNERRDKRAYSERKNAMIREKVDHPL